MFSIGIIGLPNVGKSTLFKALTKIQVPISIYPFTTIDPNRGIVKVKDERLEKIKRLVNPQKVKPVLIEFVDIAGLVKGAHRGRGLGNQFLSYLSGVDLLVEVIRTFKNEKVTHIEGEIDPKRDIEIIKDEILAWDKKILLTFLENLRKKIKSKKFKKDIEEQKIAEKFEEILEKGSWPAGEVKKWGEDRKGAESLGKKIGLLSIKPLIYLFNTGNKNQGEFENLFSPSLFTNLKEEEEISNLSEKEREEIKVTSYLDELILACYNKLDLISFYTIKGEREIRAYEMKKGENVIEAAKSVHSDFKEKFIRAEVLNFKDLIESGSWQEAKGEGKIQIKGRDYIVNDGDIIEFKI